MELHKTHHLYKSMFLVVMLSIVTNFATADVKNIRASIDKNKSISLDLSQSITNIAQPLLTISTQPANGTATAEACADNTVRCITYQPNTDFVGLDTFNYQVINDAGLTESATIIISVGGATSSTQGTTSNEAIEGTLNNICLNNAEGELSDLCRAFSLATEQGEEEDLRELLDALSPQNVASQGTLSNELIKAQLANISKRLTALRRGQQNTFLSGLTLRHNGQTLTGDLFDTLFATQTTGGSAGSGSGFNNKWDWYISGKIGGGEQDETEFEDGFEFDANNITTGADLRLHNQAIIGGALSYGVADMEINRNGGGMDIDGVSATLYGSYYPTRNTYIDAIVNVGVNRFEMRRRIVFGLTDVTANSQADSASVALSIAGGYDYVINAGLSASFRGGFDYIDTAIDGYAESGGDGFEVVIKGQDVNQLLSTLGAQLNYVISLPWGVLLPYTSFSWLHQFDDDTNNVEGYFLADSNQTPFRFEVNATDSDYFVASLGTSAVFAGGRSAFIQYETSLAQNNLKIWNISAGLRLEF